MQANTEIFSIAINYLAQILFSLVQREDIYIRVLLQKLGGKKDNKILVLNVEVRRKVEITFIEAFLPL